MSDFIDSVVANCLSEYQIFENGLLKEYDEKVYKRIGKYWDELAKIHDYSVWKGYNGRSAVKLKFDPHGNIEKVLKNKNQPWSAAFISWIAKQSGAGQHFSYAPSHSVYIVEALREAAKNTSTAKFIARRHTGYQPKIGDLIACERREDTDADFDNYIAHVKAKKFEAHCDFVVSINGTKNLETIGGNVSNSVSKKKWTLTSGGRIGDHDPKTKTSRVICIIECRL